MTPIENPFFKEDKLGLAKAEIKEFLESDCLYCEFKTYKEVSLTTNAKRFNQARSCLGATRKINIRQSKGRLIGVKL